MRLPEDQLGKQFGELMLRYRDACPAPEASAGFMPALWERIESRNRFTAQFRRWAHGFVTAAAAASLVFAALQFNRRPAQTIYTTTYLESLTDEQSPDQMILQDVASFDNGDAMRQNTHIRK